MGRDQNGVLAPHPALPRLGVHEDVLERSDAEGRDEALEEVGLANAIAAGRADDFVSEDEIFSVLDGESWRKLTASFSNFVFGWHNDVIFIDNGALRREHCFTKVPNGRLRFQRK